MTFEAQSRAELLAFVAEQVSVTTNAWTEHAARDETRREHALELQSVFGYRPFTTAEYRKVRGLLTDLALQTNKALALAEQLIERLRNQRIIVPAITMIDRLCAEARTWIPRPETVLPFKELLFVWLQSLQERLLVLRVRKTNTGKDYPRFRVNHRFTRGNFPQGTESLELEEIGVRKRLEI